MSAQNGTATLGVDGQTVTFLPSPGYTGPASFQFQADDGYSTSPVGTVTVTVSTAPLVSLDFTQRAPELLPGDTQMMSVIGDFADEQDVALPSSYLTFQTADPTVAVVTTTGQLLAVAPGNTALVVSSHGIQAATVVDIDDPNALVSPDYSGLEVAPQAITLADNGGMQQLNVELVQDQSLDFAAGATGTLYYSSNPTVVTASPDGLVTAVGDGTATVTVIAYGQQVVIPVQVVAAQSGPQTIGAGGGVVSGSDGSQLDISPGALSSGTTVNITPVSLSSLPEGPPSGFQFIGAERIDLGGQALALPAEAAIPVPTGTPVGTEVYAFLATTLPDATGAMYSVWQEVDVGVVGANGFAQTGTPPYPGILSEGTYAFAIANDPSQVAQVSVTLDPSSIAVVLGATYALVDQFGGNADASIMPYNPSEDSPTFTLDMPVGLQTLQIVGIEPADPTVISIQLTIAPGNNTYTVSGPLLQSNTAPLDPVCNGKPQQWRPADADPHRRLLRQHRG